MVLSISKQELIVIIYVYRGSVCGIRNVLSGYSMINFKKIRIADFNNDLINFNYNTKIEKVNKRTIVMRNYLRLS